MTDTEDRIKQGYYCNTIYWIFVIEGMRRLHLGWCYSYVQRWKRADAAAVLSPRRACKVLSIARCSSQYQLQPFTNPGDYQ